MNKKGYVIFSVCISLAIIIIDALFLIIAFSSAQPEYPVYAYEQYVDRTQSMVLKHNAGAQLYEAENADLFEGAEVEENVTASARECVHIEDVEAIIKFDIAFDRECNVQIGFCISYRSEFDRSTEHQNLFNFYLNGKKQNETVNIADCYNEYEFKENVGISVKGKAGTNELRLISTSKDWAIDYIVLVVEEERTVEEETVSLFTYPFSVEQSAKIYESEYAYRNGAVVVYESTASGSYHTQFFKRDDSIVFRFNSLGAASSLLELNVNNYGNKEFIFELFEIYVNEIPYSSEMPLFKGEATKAGNVQLKRGLNEIKIVALAPFFLDYIRLNGDVGYSPVGAVLYEAEKFVSDNGAIRSDNAASNGGVVVSNGIGTSCSVTFTSRLADEAYLAFSLKYTGTKTLYSDILNVYVNEIFLDFSDVVIATSVYHAYSDVYLAKINVAAGENTINVVDVAAGVQLDYFIIFNDEAGYGSKNLYEAENQILTGGCQEEWNLTASNKKNVGYNKKNSSIKFYVYAEEKISAEIRLSVNCKNLKDLMMKECFTVNINGSEWNTTGIKITASRKWNDYREYPLGEISLEQGLNIITVTSKQEIYNVDYMLLRG